MNQTRHIRAENLPWIGDKATIHLRICDSAWNPASTSRRFWGPGRVYYTRHPDGGISARFQAESPNEDDPLGFGL